MNGAGYWWIPTAEPVLEPPGSESDLSEADRKLAAELSAQLEDPALELPPLPAIAQRVMATLQRDDADFHKVAELVSQDQVLAAEVLRVVNSAAYRGVSEISRLDTAFSRLGLRALRSLMLRVTVKAVTVGAGGSNQSWSEELWRCSLASAAIMEYMGKLYALTDADAFVVGLLHDIGKVVVLKLAADRQKGGGTAISRPVFDYVCARRHEEVGQRLAGDWNLPAPLPDIIGDHHGDPPGSDECRVHRLLLQFADVACAMLGYAPYVPYDFLNLGCVSSLGLDDSQDNQRILLELADRVRLRTEML